MFKFLDRFKKPKVEIWPLVDGLEKVVPPVPANKHIPNWFKEVDQVFVTGETHDRGTVKHCPSFPEYFKTGFIMPMWCDLKLNIREDGYDWETPDRAFIVEEHKHPQYRDFLPAHEKEQVKCVLKLLNPWRVKTPPGWSILQLPLYYHFSDLFEVVPGMIWTDIHHETNLQLKIKKYGQHTIPRGTPLVHYIPYKRSENLPLDIGEMTRERERFSNINWWHVHTKFVNGYKLKQNEMKKKPKGKCPYGFDK
jgi:hypothetical protein